MPIDQAFLDMVAAKEEAAAPSWQDESLPLKERAAMIDQAIIDRRKELKPFYNKAAELLPAMGDFQKSTRILDTVPKQDWDKVIEAADELSAESRAEGIQRPGWWARLGQSVIGGFTGAAQDVERFLNPPPVEQMDALRQVKGIALRDIGTIRPEDTFLDRTIQQTGGMIGPMAQMVGTGRVFGAQAAGMGLSPQAIETASRVGVTLAGYPQAYNMTLDEMRDLGIKTDVAKKVAPWTALAYSAAESFLPDPWKVEGKAIGESVRQAAARYGTNFLKRLTIEGGEEGVQGSTAEFGAAVASQLDKDFPNKGYGEVFSRGFAEMVDSVPSLVLMLGTGDVIQGAASFNLPSAKARLQELRGVLNKKYVSEEDGKTHNIPGDKRRERLAAATAEATQLEQEISDAEKVYRDQGGPTETGQVGQGGEVDRRGDVYQGGQVEESPQPAGEVATAPEVPLGPESPDVAELNSMSPEALAEIYQAVFPDTPMPESRDDAIRQIVEVWGGKREDTAKAASDLAAFSQELAQQEKPSAATTTRMAGEQDTGAVSEQGVQPVGQGKGGVARPTVPTNAPAPAVSETAADAGQPEGREGVDHWANLPSYIVSQLRPLAESAEKSRIADKIEDLAAQQRTAKQIAEELGIEEDVVKAVRINRGIPSWTVATTMGGAAVESPEFTEWLKKREAKTPQQPPAAPQPPVPTETTPKPPQPTETQQEAAQEAADAIQGMDTSTVTGERKAMQAVADIAQKHGLTPNELWRDVYYDIEGGARDIESILKSPLPKTKGRPVDKPDLSQFKDEAAVKEAYQWGKLSTGQAIEALDRIRAAAKETPTAVKPKVGRKPGVKPSKTEFTETAVGAGFIRKENTGKKQYAFTFRDKMPNNRWLAANEISDRLGGKDAGGWVAKSLSPMVDAGLLTRMYRPDGTPVYAWTGTEPSTELVTAEHFEKQPTSELPPVERAKVGAKRIGKPEAVPEPKAKKPLPPEVLQMVAASKARGELFSDFAGYGGWLNAWTRSQPDNFYKEFGFPNIRRFLDAVSDAHDADSTQTVALGETKSAADVVRGVWATFTGDPNVDSSLKTPEQWQEHHVDSEVFTLADVPIGLIDWQGALGSETKYEGESKSTEPIVIDANKNQVGRHLGRYGAAPDTIVLDGQHRLKKARERGDVTIRAWVGDAIAKRLRLEPAPQVTPQAAEKQPWEMTAKEAVEAGVSYPDWSRAVEEAFRNENIDEDHPAWKSISEHREGVGQWKQFEGQKLIGQQITTTPPGTQTRLFGEVVGATTENGLGMVKLREPSGRESTHYADNVDNLVAWIADRERRGRSVPAEARSLVAVPEPSAATAPQVTSQAAEKQPWEMTKEEFTQKYPKTSDANVSPGFVHRHLVTQAVAEGKPVPDFNLVAYNLKPPTAPAAAPVSETATSTTRTPQTGEGESEYLERMVGAPGSQQRAIGDPAAVEHFRNIWRAHQRQQATEQAVSETTPEIDTLQAKVDAVWTSEDWQYLVDGRVRTPHATYGSEAKAEDAMRRRAIPVLKDAYRQLGYRLYHSPKGWRLTSDKSLPKEYGTAGVPGSHHVNADLSFFADLKQGVEGIRKAIEAIQPETAPESQPTAGTQEGTGGEADVVRIADKLVTWKQTRPGIDPPNFRSSWIDYDFQKKKAVVAELVDRGELPVSFARRRERKGGEYITATELLDGLTRNWATDKFKTPTTPVREETAAKQPAQQSALSQAAEAAKQDLSDSLSRLGKAIDKKRTTGAIYDPKQQAEIDIEILNAAMDVVANLVKVGVKQFQLAMDRMVTRFGAEKAEKYRPAIERAWDDTIAQHPDWGMEARETEQPAAPLPEEPPTTKPPAPPREQAEETTGTKNVKTDELRAKAGLGERVMREAESVEQWQLEAANRIATDSSYPGRLAEELAATPRAIDRVEEAVLNRHIRDLENRRLAGENVRDEMLTAVEASERVGTIWGQTGVSRQTELAADFSVAGIIRQHLRSINEQPTDEQMAKYEEMADRIKQMEAERDELQQKLAQSEVERRIAEAAEAKKKPSTRSKIGSKREKLERKAADAVSAFKQEWATLFQMGAVFDPKREADKWIKITKAAGTVVKAYADLGIDSFLQLMSRVKQDFEDITSDQAEAFKEAWQTHKAASAIESPLGENPDKAAIGARARELMQWAVEAGIDGRENVIDAVHEQLSEESPGITRSDTMQAMSGYGDFRELSKDETSVKVRGYRGEIQQLLKLESMQAGQAPKKTGVERRQPTDEERRLIKLVNEAKKRGGYEVTDPERQLKSALGTAKTAIRNRISDLEQEIATREKIVKERTLLEPDAELTALREQRDKLLEEHKKIFPPKKSPLNDAQRLKMAERAIDRQIEEMEADLKAGRLGPKEKAESVTSPALEAKKQRRAELYKARDMAREASPEYQAQESARQTARYKKALEKRLEFWEKRRDEAIRGKLPKKRKPTPLDNEILEKKYQIELVKRHARAEIEEAERAARGRAGKALGFGGDLLDLSRALMTGYELSAVLRQGAAYTLGFPRQAFPAVWDSVRAAFDRRVDYSLHDDLMQRPNHIDYVTGNLETTADDGPLSHREELLRSRIASWLAQTEGWGWAVPRWAAEGLLGSERAFRTFLNTMRADLFDYMKDSVESSRPGTWSPDDAKVIGNASNVFSGRAPMRNAVGWSRVFFAPRWIWSRAQLMTGQPLWRGDSATRLAVGKVYVRGALGIMASIAIKHVLYSLLAGDDEERKPRYELNPLSSDFAKTRLGETRLDAGTGVNQIVTLAARLITGKTKRTSGDVVPIRGEDVPYGADDSRQIVHRFLDTKLAPLPSAVLDFMAGENVVGEKATAGTILGSRVTPMTWRDIWEAEKELNVPQGTVAAIEAFFGTGISTYGPRSKYRDYTPEQRKEQFEKDLDNMEWDSEPPAYSEFLTTEQMKLVGDRVENRKQSVVSQGLEPEPKRTANDTDKSYQKKLETHAKAQAKLQEMIQALNLSHAEAQQLLVESYRKPDSKGKMQTEINASDTTKFDASYWGDAKNPGKAKILAKLYGYSDPAAAVREFRQSPEFKAWLAEWNRKRLTRSAK